MKHKAHIYKKKFEPQNVLSYFRVTVLDLVTFHTNKMITVKRNFNNTRYTQSSLTIAVTIYS